MSDDRSTLHDRACARITERLREVLGGESPLRTALRYRIGVEDSSLALGSAIDVLDAALRLGADPDVALAAGTTAALIEAFVRVRAGIEPGNGADAINAGDLLLSLAFDEARKAGAAALERTLGLCVAWIETGDREALMRSARAIGEVVAGTSTDGKHGEPREPDERGST